MGTHHRVSKVRGPHERHLLREVQPRDLDSLYALSQHLNSVNFPHDLKVLKQQITKARRSFTKALPMAQGQFMFVLEGVDSGRIAGTSMVYGQHGTPEAPHIFFDVFQNERYSTTLNRHFTHTTLRLGFNYQGPSEIGALVLHPDVRGLGLGKPLSFARFLFMAMYRDRFRDEVIAELMPPLTKDGRSLLWDHVGRRFTGLDYQEADKLSHDNKEFIISLFPQAIHATLLPESISQLIGQVGEETRGVKQMLQSIGFRYSHRIDPFDGGPHFHASIDDLSIVRNSEVYALHKESVTREDEYAVLQGGRIRHLNRYLVGVGQPEPPYKFRAMVAIGREEEDELVLSAEVKQKLKIRAGDEIWAVAY